MPAEKEATEESADEATAEAAASEEAETEEGEAAQGEEAAEGEAAEEAEASEPEEPQPTPEEIEQIKAERERIKLNNQRAQDEYNEKLAAGKKRVEELNARFGDWYYVIPNDVFKKVHLGRDQVIKSPEPAAGEAADKSAFGLPGGMIPGLPNIFGSSTKPADETPAEPAGEPDTAGQGDSAGEGEE